mgnify:CR=1 FL=1
MTTENNAYYKVGDSCYVLDRKYNKIKFCEVLGVLTGLKECEVAYELRDYTDYRFFISSHENCSDTEAGAKKLKIDTKEARRQNRIAKK